MALSQFQLLWAQNILPQSKPSNAVQGYCFREVEKVAISRRSELREQVDGVRKQALSVRAREHSILVPEGFCTDLASVPQAFWSLLPKNGRHVYAAIIHDYLYWRQKTSRIEADEILKLTMIEEKVAWWKIDSIYLAVRSAEAQSAWDDNKRAKDAGQMRFLAKFPPRDQRVTWAEWKSDPANLRDDETADRVGRYAL